MIGVSAPISLSVLRLIQGIALGGEWGGASLMVSEIDPEGRRRGLYGSMVQVASPVGYLLAYGMFTVVTYSDHSFTSRKNPATPPRQNLVLAISF
jgi:MFS family permease